MGVWKGRVRVVIGPAAPFGERPEEEVERLRNELRVAKFNVDHWQRGYDDLMGKLLAANRRSEAKSRWDVAQLLKSVATHTMTKTRRSAWEDVIQWVWKDEWGTFAERFPDDS